MILAPPKAGLEAPGVTAYAGELYLADVGVPPRLDAEATLRLTVGHVFAQNDLVRLW